MFDLTRKSLFPLRLNFNFAPFYESFHKENENEKDEKESLLWFTRVLEELKLHLIRKKKN